MLSGYQAKAPGMFTQKQTHSAKASNVRSAGFTLIELMFVVTIIGIVLALAYPSYLDSVRKARRADAAAALLDWAQSLERCFTRFNQYNHADCPDPEGTTDDGFYTITVERDGTTFTLTATPLGDQLNDPCGTFTVNYLGQKTPVPGSNRCWGSNS
ncbi:MAG TPA: type IV pilin protein [Xanthomonadales bacterium]|nr:type IV pilin protein [Xanthomonadales bacterium]